VILLDKACVWLIQRFGVLPALPWRPHDGTGASIGPLRAAGALLVCCGLWGPATNPAPPRPYDPDPAALPFFVPAAPVPDWRGKHTAPEPSGLAVFLVGIVAIVGLTRARRPR
jgi:hypothetical protein